MVNLCVSTVLFWQMVQNHDAVSWALKLQVGFLYILFIMPLHLDGKARHQLMALILIVFTIVFWALFEQAYTSMNLFADKF
jgi:POT family proton-dependent oligopeptide transporter